MNQILRSRQAMVLATVAAALAAVGALLGVIGFATLDVGSPGVFDDLGHAHDWLFFSGSVLVLGAVGLATWRTVAEGQRSKPADQSDVLELLGATVATLLFALGSLVSAISTGTSGDTVGAVGIGLWGLLALSRAARHRLFDPPPAGEVGLGPLWLGVSVGLVVLAVGSGIAVDPSNQGSSMASGIVSAVGVGGWAGAIALARSQGRLRSRLVPWVVAALWLATASYIAQAVVAGTVFGPEGTVTGLRIGGAIILALLGLSLASFGWVAWRRAVELPSAPATSSPRPSTGGTEQGDPVPTAQSAAAVCSRCAGPLVPWARFCPSCGAPVERS